MDVVGHIENEPAVIRAVEAVDREMGRVIEEAGKGRHPRPCHRRSRDCGKMALPRRRHRHGSHLQPRAVYSRERRDRDAARKGGRAHRRGTHYSSTVRHRGPEVHGRQVTPVEQNGSARSVSVVLILDGWGYNPETKGNLIARARTPVMDRLLGHLPFAVLAAAGESVGLPAGTVGNSEAGHLHIGAGRRVYSDRLKIDRAIESGAFFRTKPSAMPWRRHAHGKQPCISWESCRSSVPTA